MSVDNTTAPVVGSPRHRGEFLRASHYREHHNNPTPANTNAAQPPVYSSSPASSSPLSSPITMGELPIHSPSPIDSPVSSPDAPPSPVAQQVMANKKSQESTTVNMEENTTPTPTLTSPVSEPSSPFPENSVPTIEPQPATETEQNSLPTIEPQETIPNVNNSNASDEIVAAEPIVTSSNLVSIPKKVLCPGCYCDCACCTRNGETFDHTLASALMESREKVFPQFIISNAILGGFY